MIRFPHAVANVAVFFAVWNEVENRVNFAVYFRDHPIQTVAVLKEIAEKILVPRKNVIRSPVFGNKLHKLMSIVKLGKSYHENFLR